MISYFKKKNAKFLYFISFMNVTFKKKKYPVLMVTAANRDVWRCSVDALCAARHEADRSVGGGGLKHC